jgi:hypothetical protein
VVRRLRESFGNFWDASWREIAMLTMGRFVVNQHEVLSYEKVWDGSRALFHSEQGVIRWRGLSYDDVAAGNPRFYSAVQILEDLALLEHEDGDWSQVSLTPEGVKLLKAELRSMEEK